MTRVTQKIFDCVKTLIDCGTPKKEIASYLKVSYSTVVRISQAETLTEYHNTVASVRRACYAKQSAKATKADVTPAATKKDVPYPSPSVETAVPTTPEPVKPAVTQVTVPWSVQQLLMEQNKLLTLISDKLAYIVQELT